MLKKPLIPRHIMAIALFVSAALAAPVKIGPYEDLSLAPDVMARFEIVTEKSQIVYYGASNAHDFKGVTGRVSGVIEGNPRRMERTGRVEIKAVVASFDSGDSLRDKKMQKTVETEKYPFVTFLSKSLKVLDQKGVPDYKLPVEISGKLSFHGRSKNIALPVRLGFNPDDYTMSAVGTFRVNMKDFDIEIPSLLFFTVDNVFKIKFRVVARLVSPLPGEYHAD